MKKATLSIAVLLIGFLFLNSQGLMAQAAGSRAAKEAADKKKSVLKWDKAKHVFGSIEHNNPVTAKFVFTNNGKKAMVITKVGVTCGCTSPIYPKEPIKPGAKGTIKLVFDAKTPGFFKKAVKVHFSDGTEQELEIEGKVTMRRSSIR